MQKASLASELQYAHKRKDGEMPDRMRWREPSGNGVDIIGVQIHELIGMLYRHSYRLDIGKSALADSRKHVG